MIAPIKLFTSGLRQVLQRRRISRISATYAGATGHIRGSHAFTRLHSFSLAVSSANAHDSARPAVIVLVPEAHPDRIFAGVRTALEFACGVAVEMSLPLKIISIGTDLTPQDRNSVEEYVRREFGHRGEVLALGAGELIGLKFSGEDTWIATHWTTAHSLDIACQLGVVDRDRVVYLVQDYEPGFHAWSTDFALARSTYHAGFRHVVNSSPLQKYLLGSEGLVVDDEMVFAPSLDLTRARKALRDRKQRKDVQVLFYARPSKPRNLFGIGTAALSIAARELASLGVVASFYSAGERHEDIELDDKTSLVSLGKLSWDDYFDLLGRTDVMLSLQLSPHPSHPPLDAIASGCFSVTNELGATRHGLHERLLVAEPESQALAEQIVRAVLLQAKGEAVTGQADKFRLGQPLVDVCRTTVSRLKTLDATKTNEL